MSESAPAPANHYALFLRGENAKVLLSISAEGELKFGEGVEPSEAVEALRAAWVQWRPASRPSGHTIYTKCTVLGCPECAEERKRAAVVSSAPSASPDAPDDDVFAEAIRLLRAEGERLNMSDDNTVSIRSVALYRAANILLDCREVAADLRRTAGRLYREVTP